jgi:hypothetical protein
MLHHPMGYGGKEPMKWRGPAPGDRSPHSQHDPEATARLRPGAGVPPEAGGEPRAQSQTLSEPRNPRAA